MGGGTKPPPRRTSVVNEFNGIKNTRKNLKMRLYLRSFWTCMCESCRMGWVRMRCGLDGLTGCGSFRCFPCIKNQKKKIACLVAHRTSHVLFRGEMVTKQSTPSLFFFFIIGTILFYTIATGVPLKN